MCLRKMCLSVLKEILEMCLRTFRESSWNFLNLILNLINYLLRPSSAEIAAPARVWVEKWEACLFFFVTGKNIMCAFS
jgi:hypothetical protein